MFVEDLWVFSCFFCMFACSKSLLCLLLICPCFLHVAFASSGIGLGPKAERKGISHSTVIYKWADVSYKHILHIVSVLYVYMF